MEIKYPPNEGMPKLPAFRPEPWILPLLLIALVFTAAGTIFYQVEQDEAGVVQRFGRYVRTTDPGLHMKLPFGIETVKNIKTTYVYKEEFGFRTLSPGVRSIFAGRENYLSESARKFESAVQDTLLEESLMLTGDLNVAIVEWIVQYTIKDPVQYAFRMRDTRETIRNMSEAVMRLVVGDHTINRVLTTGREEIQQEAEKKLQELMDSYRSGIAIRNVILQNVTPPKEVEPSFNEVNEARQEKEKVINQAWEEYNRIIPKAHGQATQKISEAEGYALERINHAKGDAERFELTLKTYSQAPDITRKRLYLETMEEVLPTLQDKLIVDESQKGLLPLLNLNPKEGEKKS